MHRIGPNTFSFAPKLKMSFDQFLDALLSEDNAKRKAAEAVFQSAKANPAEVRVQSRQIPLQASL